MRENHVNGVLYTSDMLVYRMDEKRLQTMTETDDQNYRNGKVRDREALNEDRRKTIDELADHFEMSHGTVYYIIKK